MRQCGTWPIGVCSWSFQREPPQVAEAMRRMGIEQVNLAVRSAMEDSGGGVLRTLQRQDWKVFCTMIDFPGEDYSTLASIRRTGGIAPDDAWPANRRLFQGAVKVSGELGAPCLMMHAGFIDHSNEAYVRTFYDRLRCLADMAAAEQITLLLETGQETAAELREFLERLDHPAVGVNFDPANMILYGKGDPLEALSILAPWIRHLHAKDALVTSQPGTWGTEVCWGDGQVGGERFLTALRQIGFDGVLAIEREAGNDREGDIRLAADRLEQFTG
ncbi:MAG: sugar phosphate isomerase/epimerase [Sedimentisphaerales bacterium]|nr:sugar phosphate isomerase/epimerase [Sedimentisphaerales bacterium]